MSGSSSGRGHNALPCSRPHSKYTQIHIHTRVSMSLHHRLWCLHSMRCTLTNSNTSFSMLVYKCCSCPLTSHGSWIRLHHPTCLPATKLHRILWLIGFVLVVTKAGSNCCWNNPEEDEEEIQEATASLTKQQQQCFHQNWTAVSH